ncbi:polymorphic toxin-type HINT domain-containing protein [Microbulbifer sp. JTAC008]|uniref:polymorphic toxin-type HINT domain-containing protein n=1 Tax=Microbulbifer sp. JTAC008 TaxID=3243374 RepID=UPI004039990D
MRNLTASILFLGAIILSALAGAEETLTFYHNDMLGSPVAASDKDGELLWTESYEPYGKKRGDKQSLNHRGYTGHAEDANTGLVYMQARYYDPLIGRFYSMDPVGYLGHLERGNPIQGMNRYAYANNNPYKYNDPDGEFLNFAVKFAADVALTAALNYAETGSLNLTGAVGEAAVGMLNPAKTLQKFNRVAKLYKKGGGCSFTPETLILTQDGYKAIIEVQVGDIVLSKNDITGELSWREVTDTFKDWHQETITFTVVDENGIQETITTTAEHPFYIAGQGWLPAGEIGIDTVFAGSSPESAIKVVGIAINDSPQYAYNFTVDTDHTYFVGKTDVWVHNTCDFDVAKGASGAFKKQFSAVDNLVAELMYSKRVNVNLKIPGGVAGAIRHTKRTGELVGDSDHIQKGRNILGKLKKIRKRVDRSHSMSDSERSLLLNTINHHIDDLSDALKGL